MQLYAKVVHPRLIEDFSLLVDYYSLREVERIARWRAQQDQTRGGSRDDQNG